MRSREASLVLRASILTAADVTAGGLEDRLLTRNRPSQEGQTITSVRIAKCN